MPLFQTTSFTNSPGNGNRAVIPPGFSVKRIHGSCGDSKHFLKGEEYSWDSSKWNKGSDPGEPILNAKDSGTVFNSKTFTSGEEKGSNTPPVGDRSHLQAGRYEGAIRESPLSDKKRLIQEPPRKLSNSKKKRRYAWGRVQGFIPEGPGWEWAGLKGRKTKIVPAYQKMGKHSNPLGGPLIYKGSTPLSTKKTSVDNVLRL